MASGGVLPDSKHRLGLRPATADHQELRGHVLVGPSHSNSSRSTITLLLVETARGCVVLAIEGSNRLRQMRCPPMGDIERLPRAVRRSDIAWTRFGAFIDWSWYTSWARIRGVISKVDSRVPDAWKEINDQPGANPRVMIYPHCGIAARNHSPPGPGAVRARPDWHLRTRLTGQASKSLPTNDGQIRLFAAYDCQARAALRSTLWSDPSARVGGVVDRPAERDADLSGVGLIGDRPGIG
jgi:hypothetical protein